MRVVTYIRISTDSKYGKQDPETQRLPLTDYCKRQGWEIKREYLDDVSAVKSRPQFDQMMRDAKANKFDAVICVKLDRMFRSTIDCLMTLDELRRHEIRFICMTQGIDTDMSNAISRMQMGMLAVIAEFERELIRERVKAGIARRKSQGLRFGGRTPKLETSPILGPCIRVGTGRNKDLITVAEVRKMLLTMSRIEIAKRLKCGRNLITQFLKEKGSRSD